MKHRNMELLQNNLLISVKWSCRRLWWLLCFCCPCMQCTTYTLFLTLHYYCMSVV